MPRSLMDLLCWPLAFFCQRAAGAAVTYEIDGKRYRMRHLLGEGGFSFVYKITDNGGGSYALKKILAQSEELLEGGLREIDVLRQFGGRPNIMPLLASAVTEIRPGVKELLLLLPHYERGTVQDVIEAREAEAAAGGGQPPEYYGEDQACSIIIGVCCGLLALHENSPEPLAHFDLKPGNVMLDAHGAPLLIDFGSTRPARRAVRSRREALELQEFAAINCTMAYRAPELWEPPSHCDIDERVDVWSLGCLFYAMMYGRSPFEIATATMGGSIAVAVASGHVNFPAGGRKVSAEYISLAKDMIEVNSSQRPTVKALRNRAAALCGHRDMEDPMP